jgi:hypothetical protein
MKVRGLGGGGLILLRVGGGGLIPTRVGRGAAPLAHFIPQTANLTGSVRLLEARDTGSTYVGIYIMKISVLGEYAK